MADRRDFHISTPRGQIVQIVTKEGTVKAKLEWNPDFGSEKSENFSRAQMFVDSECLRRCDPLTPRDTGMLIKSGALGTVIGSGSIEYLAPYARRQYYEHKGDGQRGSLWFERMKISDKEMIRKGAAEIIDGK